MAKTWSVNNTGDIHTTPGGRLAINRDLDAVMQQCEHAIKTHKGEMIYDRNRGIDYENTVFSGSSNTLAFEGMVREAINSIQGVNGITDFDAQITGHTLYYTLHIQTIYGTGIIKNGDTDNGRL